MKSEKINALINKAQKKIEEAEEALMKPQEDVIAFGVCNNSRLAIRILLESYLRKYNITFNSQESLELLMERCIILNPDFKSVNINEINCRHDQNSQNYCEDQHKLDSCLTVAKQIELLVAN